MSFQLEQIVPWGRSFSEYRKMFSLTEEDLGKAILGCGDGPASFNAEATRRGVQVTSVDPIYALSAEQIESRFHTVKDEVLAQTHANRDRFVWDLFKSVDELAAARTQAMAKFISDFPHGIEEGRYLEGALPRLDLDDQSHDLALVSHLLFLYDQHLDFASHVASVKELLRVAHEVRVFPLLSLDGSLSEHVPRIIRAFSADYRIRPIDVNYEFQIGGNQMLQITRT